MTGVASTAAKNLAGYAGAVGALAAASVLQVAVLVRLVGSRAWGEVALAQSAAALAAAVVALGWTTVGPSVVALHPTAERVHFFARTLVARAYAFVVVAPILFAVVFAVAVVDRPSAGFVSVASLLPVMGASWYFVGQGSPTRLLVRDVAPQVVGVLAGLLLAVPWGVPGFGIGVLCGNACAVVLGIRGVMLDGTLRLSSIERSLKRALMFTHTHRQSLAASWAGSANSYLPMLFVGWLAPLGLPQYALADRLLRYALGAFSPVVQFVQGWVPAGAEDIQRRSRRALGVACALGGTAGAVIVFVGDTLAKVLSGGRLMLGPSLLLPFGVAIGFLVVGQVTALALLVPLGRTRSLARSTVAGTTVLAVGCFPAGVGGGATGLAWTMAACEVLAVTWQVLSVVQATRVRVSA